MAEKILLIIDDDQDLRESFVDILKDELADYTIIEAVDGLEGLESIKKFNPTIIICDNQMPRMKGFELVEQLNTQNINVNKFFLHTGDSNPPKLILQGDPVEIWAKPYPFSEILESIRKVS